MSRCVLFLDGFSLLFRAFYALPEMATTRGVFTGGLYGLSNLILKLLREQEPMGAAFALDAPQKTFRHRVYPAYTAGRAPAAMESPHQCGSNLPRQPRVDQIVTRANLCFQFVRAHGRQILHLHPRCPREIGRWNDSFNVDQAFKVRRRALEADRLHDFTVDGDDEKHFARDLEDEVVSPLLRHRDVRQRKREETESMQAHRLG